MTSSERLMYVHYTAFVYWDLKYESKHELDFLHVT